MSAGGRGGEGGSAAPARSDLGTGEGARSSCVANDATQNLAERAGRISEYLGTGYGLRFSTEIYGNKRGEMAFQETASRKLLFLQKYPKISRSLREFTGKCNLGILY